jgi:hypothetical protein
LERKARLEQQESKVSLAQRVQLVLVLLERQEQQEFKAAQAQRGFKVLLG